MKKVFAISLALIMMIALIPTAMAQSMFTDMDGHWAQATVEELANAGVINGMGDGTYAPENPVTRSQFIKLLTVAVKVDSQTAEIPFADAAAHWSASYVAAGLASGILVASDYNGAFAPDQEITRDEAALWISRALKLTGEGAPDFTDVADITNKTAVYQAVQAGIINGMGDGTFGPKNTTTRAQSATLIKRVMDYKPAAAPTAAPTPPATVKNELSYNSEAKEYGYNEVISVDEKGVILAENDSRFTNATEVGAIVVFPANEDHPYGLVLKVTGKNHHDYNTDFPTVPATLAEAVKTLNCQKSKAFTMDGLTDASIEVIKNGDDVKVNVTATGKTKAETTASVYGIYGLLNADVTVTGDAFTAVLKYGETEFKTVTGTVTAK